MVLIGQVLDVVAPAAARTSRSEEHGRRDGGTRA
jgi:hypothetical protein